MGDAEPEGKQNAPARTEPAVAPEVNRLLLPPEVYPRAAAPPRPTVRPHVAPAPIPPGATPPPVGAPTPPTPGPAAQPSTLPPSQSFGPLLDLVTMPALGELGMQPDETKRLMGSIKGALDAFTGGKPQEALPVPQSMEKMSKMAEHLLPVVQEVVMPRVPFIIAGIQGLLKPQENAAPAPEPEPTLPSPTQRARQAGASVKDALKQKAGQTVADGGKLISFPDESREPDFATPRAASTEAAYSGPRSPPNMADVARRETKIQFYGAKDPVPGTDVAAHAPAKPRPSAADADAIRRLAPSGPSFTPANVAEGTWANERREGHEPRPDASPSSSAAPAAREPSMTTDTPQRASLTQEEAKFILDGVRGQDPALIDGLIGANMDISGFVLAKKNRLQPAQRERLKAVDFADLLALGEDLARQDAAFAERWRVLMKPKGRTWLKDNLKRIQGGL